MELPNDGRQPVENPSLVTLRRPGAIKPIGDIRGIGIVAAKPTVQIVPSRALCQAGAQKYGYLPARCVAAPDERLAAPKRSKRD